VEKDRSDRPQDDDDEVREEAALWLSRLELGTADREAFERWRSEHPAHALAFARVGAAWEALGDVVTAEDAAAASRGVRRRGLLKYLAGGAGVAAGAAVWAERSYAWTEVATGVGEYRRVKLRDNSAIELNTDSRAAWRFRGRRREIRLKRGELALTLAAGPPVNLLGAEPLAVLSPGRYDARALGTATLLTVIDGAAIAAGGATQARATSGQGLAFSTGGERLVAMSPADVERATAWQGGEIIFRDETLRNAVDEYNRYLPKKIVLESVDAGRERIGGRFSTRDPSGFLKALSLSEGLDVKETGDQYLVTQKK